MKFILSTAILLTTLLIMAQGQAIAGVSISVGEPGFYGRLDIGNYPPPRLVYREPIIVRPVNTWYPPIYLRVPPGHAKNWYKYCDRYGACGRPVYFVDDGWYQNEYVPRYHEYNRRVHAPAGPPVIYKPQYYEYRKYNHKPPKKVYIREGYDRDGRQKYDNDDYRGKEHYHK